MSATPDASSPAALGCSLEYWERFIALVRAELPGAEIGWKGYPGSSGRQCIVRMKKRNLAYLKPGEGEFTVSFALSEAAVASMADARLPQALIEEVKAARRYPEGRAARVRVSSVATLKTAAALLAVKLADVLRAGEKPRRG